MKEEEDIVSKEAFNVIKKDFLLSLNHNGGRISEAFGVPERANPTKQEIEHLRYLCCIDKHSVAVEQIMRESSNLNDFTFSLYIYLKFKLMMEREIENAIPELKSFMDFIARHRS